MLTENSPWKENVEKMLRTVFFFFFFGYGNGKKERSKFYRSETDCSVSLLIAWFDGKVQKDSVEQKKCRVLILALHSWKIQQNANFFRLNQGEDRENHHILDDLPSKSCQDISKVLQEKVRSFYKSNEGGWMCPRRKDYDNVKNDKEG